MKKFLLIVFFLMIVLSFNSLACRILPPRVVIRCEVAACENCTGNITEDFIETYRVDIDEYYGPEVVSKNVEYISFRRVDDMITVNIRTFADNDGGIGQAARSHSELTTTIQLRN